MATIPPAAAPSPAPDPAGADPTDPMAGGDDAAPDESDEVLVTISKGPDGGYIVHAGDEPDGDEEEGAEPPPGGEAPPGGGEEEGPEPVECKTIGEALKAALDILQQDEGSGGAEGEEKDFQEGFGEDKSPKMAQKY